MCRHLQVSRSGYYQWLHRKETQKERENKQIASWVIEYDQKYKHILGYRRMTNWINREKGKQYNKKRIYRIMKCLNIKAQIRKKRRVYRNTTPKMTVENKLHRDFLAQRPNQKWATDVTEFKIPSSKKKLYLSATIDLYDRSIVSYVLRNKNDKKLVFDTIDLAQKTLKNEMPLLHSDRGFQYTNKDFQKKLEKYKIEQSMSRKGCCIDNGPIEGFWGIIKSELYYISDFSTEEELRRGIEEYIYFYNNKRYQERFHNLTPMEVRKAALATTEPIIYPIPINKRILKYKKMLAEKQYKECVS